MATRSLNKVQLIGNLTRDPELRYTPSGTAVCTFGLATNRSWVTESGERREETEFHRIVAWNKLAELCSQLLFKGRRVFVEGRLQTRSWTGQDGNQRQTTEAVIEDMIILDSRRMPGEGETAGTAAPVEEKKAEETPVEETALPSGETPVAQVAAEEVVGEKPGEPSSTQAVVADTGKKTKKKKAEEETVQKPPKDKVSSDDIPF